MSEYEKVNVKKLTFKGDKSKYLYKILERTLESKEIHLFQIQKAETQGRQKRQGIEESQSHR